MEFVTVCKTAIDKNLSLDGLDSENSVGDQNVLPQKAAVFGEKALKTHCYTTCSASNTEKFSIYLLNILKHLANKRAKYSPLELKSETELKESGCWT